MKVEPTGPSGRMDVNMRTGDVCSMRQQLRMRELLSGEVGKSVEGRYLMRKIRRPVWDIYSLK